MPHMPSNKELIRESAETLAEAIGANGRSPNAIEEISNLLIEFAGEIKRQVKQEIRNEQG